MPVVIPFLLVTFAVLGMIPRLFWANVMEGQIGKQSFVAHMIQSFYSGSTSSGFPLRFFMEPWHPGVIPWAEEFPLYHLLSAGLAHALRIDPVNAARILSFLSFVLLAFSVFQITKKIFPERPKATLFAVALLAWLPGVQIYSTSVIPDLAMFSFIALAMSLRLQGYVNRAYAALMVAALFKYFAFFAILAFFIFDCLESKSLKKRVQSLVLAGLAALPTLIYVIYFIQAKIPNPITEYRDINGYGHLSGPFLFQLKFYLRYLLWVFVKNPTLIVSFAAFYGIFTLLKSKTINIAENKSWKLIFIFFGAYTLFALVFASSFYVHDYYALPFMLPVLFLAMHGFYSLKGRVLPAALIVVALVSSFLQVQDSLKRMNHYEQAALEVKNELSFIPDHSRDELCVFVSDFSQPPIPVISKKSGWSFVANRFSEHQEFYRSRTADPRTQAVVFYFQEVPDAVKSEWQNGLTSWNKVKDILIDGHQLVIYIKEATHP